MENMKKEIIFIDAEGHKVSADIEITHRNGYPEFTMSGRLTGGCGQVFDGVKPANTAQEEIITAWKAYHLKDVSTVAGFRENIDRIIKDIEDAEARRKAGKEPLSGDDAILADMAEEGIQEDMLDAVKAYIYLFTPDDLRDFEEAYAGEFRDDADFAQDMADNLGAVDNNLSWPHNCIDWEQAAHELMYDYSEHDGYYFRNL